MPLPTTTRFAGLAALLALAACAVGQQGAPLPVTEGSLLDDYKLVQGMTEGAVASDGVTRAELENIISLDRTAVNALVAVASDSSDEARERAQAAIEALADYVSSVRASQPGPPPALSRSGRP